jgi:hypothetical protein
MGGQFCLIMMKHMAEKCCKIMKGVPSGRQDKRENLIARNISKGMLSGVQSSNQNHG